MIDLIWLAAAFIAILFVLNRWHKFSLAMLTGSLIMALTGGFSFRSAVRVFWENAVHPDTVGLITVVILINLMGYVLKQTGSLEKLTQTIIMGLKDVRLVIAAVPALIGMLPVPGGAVMSAPMAVEAGQKAGLSPEQQAAANVIFRHLITLIFPLHATLILIHEMSGVAINAFVGHQFLPMVVGFVVCFYVLFRKSGPRRIESDQAVKWPRLLIRFLYYAAPIYGGILLVVAFKVNFVIAVACGVLAALLLDVRSTSQLLERLKTVVRPGLNWELGLAVMGILVFRGYVRESAALGVMADHLKALGVSVHLMAVVLPFAVGLITGTSLAGVGVTVPILTPILPPEIAPLNIFSLIFISSMVGYVISPLHMCLILTREVCRARLKGAYPYMLFPLAGILMTSLIQSFL